MRFVAPLIGALGITAVVLLAASLCVDVGWLAPADVNTIQIVGSYVTLLAVLLLGALTVKEVRF